MVPSFILDVPWVSRFGIWFSTFFPRFEGAMLGQLRWTRGRDGGRQGCRTFFNMELGPCCVDLCGVIGGFQKLGYPQSSSILMGFSTINHPFGGAPIYGNPQLCLGESSSPTNDDPHISSPNSSATGLRHTEPGMLSVSRKNDFAGGRKEVLGDGPGD